MNFVPTLDEFDGTVENMKEHLGTLRDLYIILKTDGPDRAPEELREWKEAYDRVAKKIYSGERVPVSEVITLYEMLEELAY